MNSAGNPWGEKLISEPRGEISYGHENDHNYPQNKE